MYALRLAKRGDVIDRKFYSVYKMIRDIGGFRGALILIHEWLIIAYNSKWFSIDLKASLFKVDKRSRTKRKKTQSRTHGTQSLDGRRFIDAEGLKKIIERLKQSIRYRVSFLPNYSLDSREKKRAKILESKSNSMIVEHLDIRKLFKEQISSTLSFRFLL